MTLNEFIQRYVIKPADAIIMRKKLFGMADHYVVYLGVYNYQHVFVANYTKGVKVIDNNELSQFLQYLVPTNVDRFQGSEQERANALKRAWSRVGEKAYNYLSNNCEHFKNWVHKGVNESEQVENFAKGITAVLGTIAVVGLLVAIFRGK